MLRIDATFHKATPKALFSAMRSEDAERTGGVGLLSKDGSVRGRVPLGWTRLNLMRHLRMPLWMHCPAALACNDCIRRPVRRCWLKVATVDWLEPSTKHRQRAFGLFLGPFDSSHQHHGDERPC